MTNFQKCFRCLHADDEHHDQFENINFNYNIYYG